jgi:hypothetical protein
MQRFIALILCAVSVFSQAALAQGSSAAIEPIRVSTGTVLTFHLQTRLRHADGDPLDAFPQGTVLHIKILSPIDSTTDRDGSEFRGVVVSDLAVGDGVVIHEDAEVRGLLVLLRSRNHPDGFRYELLLTQLSDAGKSYPLTASLNTSFYDAGAHASEGNATKTDTKESPKANPVGNTKIPVNPAQ